MSSLARFIFSLGPGAMIIFFIIAIIGILAGPLYDGPCYNAIKGSFFASKLFGAILGLVMACCLFKK